MIDPRREVAAERHSVSSESLARRRPPPGGRFALVVANPRSGRSDPALLRATLETLFGSFGLDYRLHVMRGRGEELGEVIQQALDDGCGLVVAAGGDGTVAAVAHHLVGRAVPLGILPLGTGNVLARELRVPPSLPDAAALLVGPHRLVSLDGIRVGTRHYFLNAGIGLNAEVVVGTREADKRRFGVLAYAFSLLRWLVGYGAARFEFRVDGRSWRRRAWDVFIANVGALGASGLHWEHDISARDGRLDLLVWRIPSPLDYFRIAWCFLSGIPLDRVLVSRYRVQREAEIVSDRRMAIQADGELIEADRLHVQVVPRAIRVVVPVASGRGARRSTPEQRAEAERIRRSLGRRAGLLAWLDTSAFLLVSRLPRSPATEAAARAVGTLPAVAPGLLAIGWLVAGRRIFARLGVPGGLTSRVLTPAALAAGIISLPLRPLLGRARVAEPAILTPVVGPKPPAWSAPSARTAAAFAAARLISDEHPSCRLPALLGASLVGTSRVYLGSHYASDILIGGLGGWLLAPAVRALIGRAPGRCRAKEMALSPVSVDNRPVSRADAGPDGTWLASR